MKLSRIYSNRPSIFKQVDFTSGLNVVYAEIRLPENKKKDTHNLGKTTLGRLIDFCLLSRKDPKFFLFMHNDLFDGLVFMLEIELLNGSFLTIRRSVNEATKIAFKCRDVRSSDDSSLSDAQWNHVNVSFDRAKELLDSILDLRCIKPWSFRRNIRYLLRSQDDYQDVFQLKKDTKHAKWKPFLAHLLGFDSALIERLYLKEEELKEKENRIKTLRAELGSPDEDISKIEGILLLKQKDVCKKQQLLDSFDLRVIDKDKTKTIVDEYDNKIAALNAERYSLSLNKKKIVASLEEDRILFDPNEAKRLFEEIGIQFPGQIKRDYEQLIAFNRALTDERQQYLKEDLLEIEAALKRINTELNDLGKKRSETLAFLKDADVFNKYRQLSEELVNIKADIATFERQRQFLHRMQELRTEFRALTEEKGRIQTEIEDDAEKQNTGDGLFSSIRVFFNDIVESVIDRKALLRVKPNDEGHLNFYAEILDESGNATSADLGHSYKKLLCIAFDMAVLRAHLGKKFSRFIYLDGVFESLDDRKKSNLIDVIREYANLGLQFVITLIDSELPAQNADHSIFANDEIVLRLHDEGPGGRLFTTDTW